MRNLFCKRLAACLRMKHSPSSSPESRVVMYRNVLSVDAGNNSNCYDLTAPSSDTTEPSAAELELTDNKMKNEWILAAAVLNVVCAIVFTFILVGGTVAFFAMFVIHP